MWAGHLSVLGGWSARPLPQTATPDKGVKCNSHSPIPHLHPHIPSPPPPHTPIHSNYIRTHIRTHTHVPGYLLHYTLHHPSPPVDTVYLHGWDLVELAEQAIKQDIEP